MKATLVCAASISRQRVARCAERRIRGLTPVQSLPRSTANRSGSFRHGRAVRARVVSHASDPRMLWSTPAVDGT